MSDLYLECLGNHQSWNNSNHGVFHYPRLEILQVFRPPPLHQSASRRILAPLHPKDQGKDGKWGSRWLNPAGRVVLINYVLSALPMYQFSTLLAPKGILKEMAQLIRKFLWQGGNQITKNSTW
jgi:hypothetical protein